jgi:hypothetical protein
MQLQHPAATYERQRNRAGEAVLVDLNFGAGEQLLRDSISDTLCDERMNQFQTRVGFDG